MSEASGRYRFTKEQILDKFGGSDKALDAHLFGQYKGLGAWAAPAMNMDKGARRQVKDTTAGKKFQAAEGSNECASAAAARAGAARASHSAAGTTSGTGNSSGKTGATATSRTGRRPPRAAGDGCGDM
jgi:hypothetical protein